MKRLSYIAILVLCFSEACRVSRCLCLLRSCRRGWSCGDESAERAAWSRLRPRGCRLDWVLEDAGVERRSTWTPPEDRRQLYLILDDGGHTLDDLRTFSAFDGVFTVAVLPKTSG